MENKVIGRRSNMGLYGGIVVSCIFIVLFVVLAIVLWGNIIWAITSVFMVIFSSVLLAVLGYIAHSPPPKNSIELVDGCLYVRPKKGEEHTIELAEITRVSDAVHPMGFLDSFYYGKVIIETRGHHYTVPFVSKHRNVAEEIRQLLTNP